MYNNSNVGRKENQSKIGLISLRLIIRDNMFESLGDRLQTAIHKIKGYGKITEQNIDEIAREIRLALLEADVKLSSSKRIH